MERGSATYDLREEGPSDRRGSSLRRSQISGWRGPNGGSGDGNPAGAYTLTVTGSSSGSTMLSHNATLALVAE
jgi:hypothetical protein